MQLFITNFSIQTNIILVQDKNILDQIRKVLRGKIGDIVFFQSEIYDGISTRYQIRIIELEKFSLKGEILKTEEYLIPKQKKKLLVAIPNKWNKAELIVQKATEIGIDEIIFWPAQRSVIQQKNNNKLQRIITIAREAAEQSWRWTLPNVIFLEKAQDIKFLLQDNKQGNTEISLKDDTSKIIVFDLPHKRSTLEDNNKNIKYPLSKNTITYGIIGPEGGLTDKDYENFGKNYQVQCLGNTVLRMETASIIAAWELCKK